MHNYIHWKKLTPSFYNSLTTGMYIAGNSMNSKTLRPCYEGYIAKPADRKKQWKKLKNNNAHNRKCWVYNHKADFEEEWVEFLNLYEMDQDKSTEI